MKNGKLHFYLILNTENRTSWEYADHTEWEAKFNALIAKCTDFNLCNETGYFKFDKVCFELKKNRLKVCSEYVLYDEFSKDFSRMFYDYLNGITERIKQAFREQDFSICGTEYYWFGKDTIAYNGDEITKIWYKLKVTDTDIAEAVYEINMLSQN